MRQKILIANWKMNADFMSITKFFANMKEIEKVKLMVAPSYLGLVPSLGLVGNKNIEVISQNVSLPSLGNHTGSVSWIELKDYGIQTTFVGHPDVKTDFKEKNYHCNQKISKLLKNGMKVVIFVEETRTDLSKDSTKENLKFQINQILEGISGQELLHNAYLVYKPTFVGDIGVKQDLIFIADTIKIIREHLRIKFGYYIGNHIPILYGGEIIDEDLEELCHNNDLDGLLLEDERALSSKFVTVLYKHLFNGSKVNYLQHYEHNVVLELPTEEQRLQEISKSLDFDVYYINTEVYFKDIKIEEEDV